MGFQLLQNPPSKESFKKLAKLQVFDYWQKLFGSEVQNLSSLSYLMPHFYSLSRPHYIWLTSASKPYECSKSLVLAKMKSGRYRTEMLCRYWSENRRGFCKSPAFYEVPGTLEHQLVSCPGLHSAREQLFEMWPIFQYFANPCKNSIFDEI